VEEARQYGFVTDVVEPGTALEHALKLAATINAWQISNDARRVVGRSNDAAEGVAAFFEKRAPEWTGT